VFEQKHREHRESVEHRVVQLLKQAPPLVRTVFVVMASRAVDEDAGIVELTSDQLCVPTRASKAWWGSIICLHVDHAEFRRTKKPDAYCKICKKMLKYYGSTGNLDDHINNLHSNAVNNAGSALQIAGQSQMERYLQQTPRFEFQLIRWMVHDYQALSVVERPAFKDMIASISPNLKVPPRKKIVARLDELEARARDSIVEALLGQFIAITADAWSSPALDAFLSLTAHYIDKNFNPATLPLECSPFSGSHTAERIYEKLQQLCNRNGISEDYVSAIVADNAANQKKAGELAPYDSLGCAPHTLQLTVKLILDDPVCSAILKKCRKIVSAFKHSALKNEELREEQERFGLALRRLLADVKTRWSSTYMSVDIMCDNQKPIDVVCMRHADPQTDIALSRHKSKVRAASRLTTAATAVAAAAVASTAKETPAAAVSEAATIAAAAAAATTARAVTRLFSGAAQELAPGALADAATDSDSDDYYSSSDDGSVDYNTPAARAPEVEVVDVGGSGGDNEEGAGESSSDSSGNSGASDFEDSLPSLSKKRKVKSKHSRASSGKAKGESGAKSSSKGCSSKKRSTINNKKAAASKRPGKTCGSGSDDEVVEQKKAPSKKKGERYMVSLKPAEWAILRMMRDLLKPFHTAQTALEGEKYITRSWLPYYINDIRQHLQIFIDEEDGGLTTAAAALLADLDVRWQVWPRATRMAVALDPRTKYMACFDKSDRNAAWADVVAEMKALYLQQKSTTATAAAISAAKSTSSNSSQPTLAAAVAAAAAAKASRFNVDLSVDPDASDEDDSCADAVTDNDILLLG
jgi:hypothetical protein